MSDLKVYTSYFYQVRNFPANLIPISTAVWDPKWFHNNLGHDHIFRDKRGVYNGFRINPLVPGKDLSGLCHGRKECSLQPDTCLFLRCYRQQLSNIDFERFMELLNLSVGKIKSMDTWGGEEAEVAFLFHEAPDNKCSEREEVQAWFRKNGYLIEEWAPPEVNVIHYDDELPFR